jgi:hypothetical protein
VFIALICFFKRYKTKWVYSQFIEIDLN